jgi:hypothetical protein
MKMRSTFLIPLMLAVVLAPHLPGQEVTSKPAPDPEIVIPVGTVFPVVLNTYLNTKGTQVGDHFYADTSYPIWIQQRLVVPRGSIVKGVVTAVNKPGKTSGKGSIAVKFESILLPNGVERQLIADFHGIHGPGAEKIDRKTETVEQGSTSNPGAELGTVVGTASTGAIIGGVASHGGGVSAGIGAGAGALVGMAIVLLSRNRDLLLEPGMQFDLELRQPLRFAYGEIIFGQDEMRRAEQTPAAKLRKSQARQPSIFPGISLPGIRRF